MFFIRKVVLLILFIFFSCSVQAIVIKNNFDLKSDEAPEKVYFTDQSDTGIYQMPVSKVWDLMDGGLRNFVSSTVIYASSLWENAIRDDAVIELTWRWENLNDTSPTDTLAEQNPATGVISLNNAVNTFYIDPKPDNSIEYRDHNTDENVLQGGAKSQYYQDYKNVELAFDLFSVVLQQIGEALGVSEEVKIGERQILTYSEVQTVAAIQGWEDIYEPVFTKQDIDAFGTPDPEYVFIKSDVDVSEPSTILLFVLGLICLIKVRINREETLKKTDSLIN